MADSRFHLDRPPSRWKRLGLVIPRGHGGEFDSSVTGDPCIVWDDEINRFRMFYFAQKHTNAGEVNANGHAVSKSPNAVGAGEWLKRGPLEYENPEALTGPTHKPWILMDPYRPNHPITIDGQYRMYTVSFRGCNKVIQVATSGTLEGPWRVASEPVLDIGRPDDFDGYQVDAVTAYWFEERQTILLVYKGYPKMAQPDLPHSPYGNSTGMAVMKKDDDAARKIGRVIPPSSKPGHWSHGWIGATQLFPAASGGWWGLVSGSPTPPAPVEEEPEMREPAPSIGGWAYTPEEWPISGWTLSAEPIEWIDDIPEHAIRSGEGVNLWRHHILVLPDGGIRLYYNTGSYGQEQMFGREAVLSV